MFADSSFILGNARVVDHPIVFANDGFCKITGYNRAEVMQQSSMLRFMWGESTDAESCKKMEEAFQKQEMLQVELLLVKKTSKYERLCIRLCQTSYICFRENECGTSTTATSETESTHVSLHTLNKFRNPDCAHQLFILIVISE